MKLTTLKLFRRKRELTQRQMAKRIGVSYSLYEKVERGRMRPGKWFVQGFKEAFPHADVDKVLFPEKLSKHPGDSYTPKEEED